MDIHCYLSEDVLIEILCRLPSTGSDVSRFKCVSKFWYAMISHTCIPRIFSHSFPSGLYFGTLLVPANKSNIIRTSSARARQRFHEWAFSQEIHAMDCASLGTQDILGLSYSRLLPFHHHAEDLVDVCNGLLLFLKSPSCRYYVCNPTTKQSVPIPKLCDHRPCLSLYAMLAFDPSKSPHCKIVRFPLFKSSDILWLAVDIFYSESQMWVRHNLKLEPPAVHGHRLCKSSVSLDSVLSRMSMSGNLLRIDLNHDDAIDAQTIVLPKLEKSVFPGCIGISRSYVCYAHAEKWDIGIWFLEARCQSYEWILQHILPIMNLQRHIMIHEFHNFNRVLWFAPFAVHPMNDVIFFGTPNLIVAYDLRSNKIQSVYKTRDGEVIPGCYHPVYVYTSCAVPLKDFGSKTTQLAKSYEGMGVSNMEMSDDDAE